MDLSLLHHSLGQDRVASKLAPSAPPANAVHFSKQTDSQTDMAPSNISPGSAATVLSFVILAGLQLETRFRVGEVLATQLSSDELSDEPERELAQLEDRLKRLEGCLLYTSPSPRDRG